jgi:hypothetical protein
LIGANHMNQIAKIGDNNPPDPIDEALAPYADAIAEAENYLDGEPVQTEAQMQAVDALIKDIRSAKSDLAKAKKSATAPLHDIWKNEIARWKPTEDDVERRLILSRESWQRKRRPQNGQHMPRHGPRKRPQRKLPEQQARLIMRHQQKRRDCKARQSRPRKPQQQLTKTQ